MDRKNSVGGFRLRGMHMQHRGMLGMLAGWWKEAENGAVRARIRPTAMQAIVAGVLACSSAFSVPQSAHPPHAAPEPELRVDINHATVDELIKVPGMTRSWAGRIVRFRPYRTKLDLVERGVLTSEVYERIKDYVIAHREKQ